MGQLITQDPYPSLTKTIAPTNSKPVAHSYRLKTCPFLTVAHYEVVYRRENANEIEWVYRFMPKRYVCVQLKKKQVGPEIQGHLLAGEKVYGYKIKYRPKTNDKIKNMLLKKRIYGDKQHIMEILAQYKLLSVMEVGPYIGTMIDGSDGHFMEGYVEYFVENLVGFRANTEKLLRKLKAAFKKAQLGPGLGFSVFNHQVVIKPLLPVGKKQQKSPELLQLDNSPRPASQLNPLLSSTIKVSSLQDTNSKDCKQIDQKTHNLSALQNFLAHKNIEKAISLYEETLQKMENNLDQKLGLIWAFVAMLDDSGDFRDYQEQVINEALGDSQLRVEGEEGKGYRKRLEEKACFIKLESKEFSSESQVDQFSQSYSLTNRSSLQKQKLKLNIQQSNKQRVRQLIKQINTEPIPYTGNDNDNGQHGINFQYAVMLMNSGKSRLALIVFESLLRNERVSGWLKYRVCNCMALIYYYRGYYTQARHNFQLALVRTTRLHYHSSKQTLHSNNIACTLYQQGHYKQALQIFTYALTHQEYGRNDYHALLRNNRAFTYLRLGELKEAKEEFMIVVNRGELINDAVILCRIYGNLGYMNMRSKEYTKARDDLRLAIEIQQRCLLPNGYRPSPALHNNMSMVRYKLREYRQALDHYTKYAPYLESLKSVQGVMFNYNIAQVYKECYKNQAANQHIEKCRRLLAGVDARVRGLWEKKIDSQCESIGRNNIDEVSDESSGAMMGEGMVSTLSKRFQGRDDVINKFTYD